MARLFNPYIALAVARSLVAGTYLSLNDSRIAELIEANAVPRDSLLDVVCGDAQWEVRKLTFDEYYTILLEVWNKRKFQMSLIKAEKAIKRVDYDWLDRRTWRPARDALDEIPFDAMLKRGWVSNPNFWSAALRIQEEGFVIEDKSRIYENLTSPDYETFLNIETGVEK